MIPASARRAARRARALGRGARVTIGSRLLVLLGATAALSTVLALFLLDRSLGMDLEKAAHERLARATTAADQLLAQHLEASAERYAAISGTPQFRANLEAGHQPTLVYHAERLVRRHGAALVAFLDADDQPVARAGTAGLLENALLQTPVGDAPDAPAAALTEHEGRLYVTSSVPLRTAGRRVGRLLAVDPLATELLEEWSALCGAQVAVGASHGPEAEALVETVRRAGPLEVRVATSVAAERAALRNARANLIAAGLVAFLVALAAGTAVGRRLVLPIRTIQKAAERIGAGEFETRLEIDRTDEIGDVARALNGMLDRLEVTQGRLASAQRFAHLGSWTIDIGSGALEGSEEFRRIFELRPGHGPLSWRLMVERAHPGDRTALEAALERCIQHGQAFQLDHRTLLHDGTERILHTQGEALAANGGPPRVEGTAQDITERKLVEDQVRYLAYHDSLTGLANRRLFEERLHLALEEARHVERGVGVIFLDIDHFKIINDTLGHSYGDELLKQVADRLVRCVYGAHGPERPGALVARLGGDEFTILIPEQESPAESRGVAERVLGSLARPFDVRGQEVIVTGSLGVTTWPEDGESVEDLLRNSDTAMYHAKQRGRNNFQFYAESMQEAAFHRLRLESKLRRALEREELELYYQPRVDAATGRVTALEALLRWRDPEHGVRLPDEFIPLAEETRLIRPIGAWVLRTAVAEAMRWPGDDGPPLRVSVNLSVHQVEEDGFVGTVAAALAETGLDPSRLELEITESTLMRDEERAVRLLGQLKEMGLELSLDDFGTGYSSLSYLKQLPIDKLKIDQAFVRDIPDDPNDMAIAEAVIAMGKALGLRVIAEGVETEEQAGFLRDKGCEFAQGFYFSKPLSADQIAELIDAKRATA